MCAKEGGDSDDREEYLGISRGGYKFSPRRRRWKLLQSPKQYAHKRK